MFIDYFHVKSGGGGGYSLGFEWSSILNLGFTWKDRGGKLAAFTVFSARRMIR